MTRHAAIRAASTDPCPFCGCGTALGAHKPARKARTATVRYPAPTYKGGWPRSGYVPLGAPAIDWQERARVASVFGGLFPPTQIPSTRRELTAAERSVMAADDAAWNAHRERGERPVITERNTVEWKPSTEEVAA